LEEQEHDQIETQGEGREGQRSEETSPGENRGSTLGRKIFWSPPPEDRGTPPFDVHRAADPRDKRTLLASLRRLSGDTGPLRKNVFRSRSPLAKEASDRATAKNPVHQDRISRGKGKLIGTSEETKTRNRQGILLVG